MAPPQDEAREPVEPTAQSQGQPTQLGDSAQLTEASLTLNAAGQAGAQRGDLERGDRIGRYIILQRVGAGGMGVVYSAYDETLDRRVALKLLSVESYGGTDASRQRGSVGRKRMLREAQAMARLSHPHVVTVHDADSIDGRVFVAMEFVEGLTLRHYLEREQPDWRAIVAIFVQAGRGLEAAHAAGLIHRDFKPDNVMIGDDGRVRVMDFGLARALAQDDQADPASEEATLGSGDQAGPEALRASGSSALSDRVTRTGAAVGTPAYMAPEQHLGAPTDARSDQFSFCVALFEALYGQRPYAGRTLGELAYAVTQGERTSVARPSGLPNYLVDAIERGLSPKSSERWPDMGALLTAIDPVLRDAPSASRKRVIGALIASTLVGGVWWSESRRADAPGPCDALGEAPSAWSTQAQNKIADAFGKSEAPFAQQALKRSSSALEDYAAALGQAQLQTCEAQKVRKELSDPLATRRFACLAGRERDFSVLVESLGDANDRLIESSLKAVDALPRIDACNDDAALERGVEAAPPEIREAVDAHERALAKAATLELAGEIDEAKGMIDAVLASPEARQYEPLRARALFRLAWAHIRASEFEPGEAVLRDAYRSARLCGDDALAVEIQALMIYVLGDAGARFDEAQAWAADALAEVERVDPKGMTHAVILTNKGNVTRQQGQYKASTELQQAALDIYTALFAGPDAKLPDHPRVAIVLNNLAISQLEGGDAKTAAATHTQALEMRERLFGPHHPDVATSLTNLGNAVRRLGDYPRALDLQERALKIREATLGPNHRRVASSVGSLAIAHAQSGNIEKATELFRDTVSRFEKGLGPDDPMVADSLSNLAQALGMQGKFDEALAAQTRALAIKEKTLGPEHPSVAVSLNSIAELWWQQQKPEQAVEFVRRALSVQRKTLEPDHPSVSNTLLRLGDIELDLGRPKEARVSFEEVLRIRSAKADEPLNLAEAKFALARALFATREQRERAKTLLDEAEATFKEIGKPAAPYLEQLQAYRAESKR